MTTENAELARAIETGDFSGIRFRLPVRVELIEDWPDKATATVTVEDDQTAVVRLHRKALVDVLLPFNHQVQDDVMSQIAEETEQRRQK